MGEVFILFFMLFAIAGLGFWIWALIDVIKNEPENGSERLTWILVVALVGWIGALIYVLVRRPTRIRMLGR